MAVIKDGVLMKVEESDMIDGVYIIPEEVKKISEQAFSEDYTEQKQEDTWMIVRKEKKTDKIKNFIKRMAGSDVVLLRREQICSESHSIVESL